MCDDRIGTGEEFVFIGEYGFCSSDCAKWFTHTVEPRKPIPAWAKKTTLALGFSTWGLLLAAIAHYVFG